MSRPRGSPLRWRRRDVLCVSRTRSLPHLYGFPAREDPLVHIRDVRSCLGWRGLNLLSGHSRSHGTDLKVRHMVLAFWIRRRACRLVPAPSGGARRARFRRMPASVPTARLGMVRARFRGENNLDRPVSVQCQSSITLTQVKRRSQCHARGHGSPVRRSQTISLPPCLFSVRLCISAGGG